MSWNFLDLYFLYIHFSYLPPSGKGMRTVPSVGALAYMERQKIVLWKQPLTTLYYCIVEVFHLLFEAIRAYDFNPKCIKTNDLFSECYNIENPS